MDTIRLIASDLDATLLDEHSQLPPNFEQKARELAGEGIIFAAASGRPVYTLEKMFEPLLGSVLLLGDNGGAAKYKGEMLIMAQMPRRYLRELARTAAEAGDVGILCAEDCAYIQSRHRQYIPYLNGFYAGNIRCVENLEDVDAKADKFTAYLPRGNAQQAFDERYGPRFGSEFSVAVSGSVWVDVTNRDANKGTALTAIGEKLGISTDEMMAFGDTYNDAPMLEAVRYGFLVANGSEPLRARVPYLAPPNTEYGVMQVLEQVLAKHGKVSPEDFVKAH